MQRDVNHSKKHCTPIYKKSRKKKVRKSYKKSKRIIKKPKSRTKAKKWSKEVKKSLYIFFLSDLRVG